ncbi:hypothetical protein PACTADRAFT_75600 [Pachysolen tannophilus NRRL Y-2460]|uniref:Oligomycin resistance ATP-dependent permease YOR1 n=1 Tax=Pachysolen tannophilus NRRL Y-2460 TaxID=669874 RepID=A0A1E4TXN5_PACTA|nr:hypothetical protein PACTADRAFT_75600 [Pachysolen tannophilus NRRL Y-2460]
MSARDIEKQDLLESLKAQKRFLSVFFPKEIPPLPSEAERNPYPASDVNIFSRIFFYWLNKLYVKGYRRTLEPADLWYLANDYEVNHYFERFNSHYQLALKKKAENYALINESIYQQDDVLDEASKERSKKLTSLHTNIVVLCVFKTFAKEIVLVWLCFLFAMFSSAGAAIFSKYLILFVESTTSSIGAGVGYAIGTSICTWLLSVGENQFFYNAQVLSYKVSSILIKLTMTKALKLDARGRFKYPSSKISSIIGGDLSRIQDGCLYFIALLGVPLPLILFIGILIWNIGVSSLAGIGVFLLLIGCTAAFATKLFSLRADINIWSDKRLAYIKEILNNFRIIKYYTWENYYFKKIYDVRKKEMNYVFTSQFIRTVMISIIISSTYLSTMISFLVLYYSKSSKRNVANIFSSISMFNILSTLIAAFPFFVSSSTDAYAGLKRFGELFSCGEADENLLLKYNDIEDDLEFEDENFKMRKGSNEPAIKIENASFEWETFEIDDDDVDVENEKEEKKTKKNKKKCKKNNENENKNQEAKISKAKDFSLIDLNLSIDRGEFIIVTGVVASGKSSLLNAMSGFMKCIEGSIEVNDSILLCGESWVQNATIKDNILFGKEYDKKKYKEVLYACDLTADLKNFPAGDNTEIGERGITLSGGQKARLSLARACFDSKNIILMDDVLSAVDAKVGKHIMENCILGYLKDKTRILATHQLSLVGAADRVIFLNGDGTIDVGTSQELLETNEGFISLMQHATDNNNEDSIVEAEEVEAGKDESQDLLRIRSTKLMVTTSIQSIDDNEAKCIGKLVEVEERAVNSIQYDVYRNYVKLGSGIFGVFFLPVLFVILSLGIFASIFQTVWLSYWTEYRFSSLTNNEYVGIYIAINIATIIFVLCINTLLVYISNNAGRLLTVKGVERLLHAPTSFMDSTPMGRILNRFTKDTNCVDIELSEYLRLFVTPVGLVVGTVILSIVYIPWVAVAVPFFAFIFFCITNYYQASSREIKRLEAVQTSFVFSHFNETLNGMNTVKAYKAEKRFKSKNDFYINQRNEALFLTTANNSWIKISLGTFSSLFILFVSLLCVAGVFSLGAGATGVLLSNLLNIADQLTTALVQFTNLENSMNSVERLYHYAFKLPQEAAYEIRETQPSPQWLTVNSNIEFRNVFMQYSKNSPFVLNRLNFEIGTGEKVGICGRTGAGKSSIMTALYRLCEITEGEIIIDQVDISKIGLETLRSHLAIIPQDPIMFSSTLRKNLDPFDKFSDDKLYDVLKIVTLVDDIEKVKRQDGYHGETLHKYNLNQSVSEAGSNYSLGERQLVSLARAILHDSKILIMDEATSSVDYDTDEKVQRIIKQQFSHCTILCIAHRLKTIIDYDRILVLEKGEVIEFDTPYNLFCTEDGVFKEMCEKSRIVESDFNKVN